MTSPRQRQRLVQCDFGLTQDPEAKTQGHIGRTAFALSNSLRNLRVLLKDGPGSQ